MGAIFTNSGKVMTLWSLPVMSCSKRWASSSSPPSYSLLLLFSSFSVFSLVLVCVRMREGWRGAGECVCEVLTGGARGGVVWIAHYPACYMCRCARTVLECTGPCIRANMCNCKLCKSEAVHCRTYQENIAAPKKCRM